ncbi:MAG: pyrroline-5-carboxylate reductase [Hyphomicrobiales bacterium]
MSIRPGGPVLLAGAGKMGGAMLERWVAIGLDPSLVFVQDPAPSPKISGLARASGFAVSAAPKLPSAPSVIVLATKPQVFDQVLPGLARLRGGDTVVLSIAAGRTIASMQKHFGADAAIVRAMPNLPASIGEGITGACASAGVTPAQAERCAALLSAVGQVAWVKDEALIDAVTAVSGSGPAYVFLLTECMAQAGVEAGLDAELAMQLARATVCGAGSLMRASPEDAAALRRNVTSPGGTTAAALEVLMGSPGLQEMMTRAIAAAAKRAKALSA